MHMRVHQAGKQGSIAKIAQLCGRRHVIPGAHLGNALTLDKEGCRSKSLLRKNAR